MPFDLTKYEPVEDRLRAFWEDCPEGRISTDLVYHQDGVYIVRAEVWRRGEPFVDEKSNQVIQWIPDATGYAEEHQTDRGVNATSALENCETSAIGRALANLGYAAKGKRPSREEMSKASASSPTGQKTSPGEAGGADTGPGEGPLPSPGFPVEKCDHRYPSGAPARVIKGGREVCKKCGVPWVTAMEGTVEDLGPA